MSFHGHKCQLAEMEGIRARLVLVEGLRSSSYDGRIEALASGQRCSERALTMKGTFFLPGCVPTNPVFHALYLVLEELPRTRRLRAGLAAQFDFAIITTDLQVSGGGGSTPTEKTGCFLH